ncbi:histidine kinase [Actinoplanes sp. NBC_00393]|uniref:sensor histidine kinase n=1 Tax=Actinoplanes sp. NBC_00393 TaxID=2975953 RepID=UPI002E20AED5
MTAAEAMNSWTVPAGAARTWRVAVHTLVGLPLGVLGFALTGVLPIGAVYCAGWSLLYANPGDWPTTVGFVLLAVVAPWLALVAARSLTMVQRRRFRVLLGADIPPPARPARGRQIAYHLLALFTGVAFAVLVVVAPWTAARVARADTALARALLGPGRRAELSMRVESLARSRADVVAATDAERRRIERDLHDGAQQRLVSLAMNLGMARANLAGTSGPAMRAIEDAHEEAVQALAEMREFVRGLHPAVLDDRGLDAALSGVAARAPLPVRLRVDVPARCSPVVEAIAYFVVSEALTNVSKHAGATHAEVIVERAAGRLRVVVTDDGRGGATTGGDGTGLLGLARRAAAVDGTFALHSPAGGPTTITVELPCGS